MKRRTPSKRIGSRVMKITERKSVKRAVTRRKSVRAKVRKCRKSSRGRRKYSGSCKSSPSIIEIEESCKQEAKLSLNSKKNNAVVDLLNKDSESSTSSRKSVRGKHRKKRKSRRSKSEAKSSSSGKCKFRLKHKAASDSESLRKTKARTFPKSKRKTPRKTFSKSKPTVHAVKIDCEESATKTSTDQESKKQISEQAKDMKCDTDITKTLLKPSKSSENRILKRKSELFEALDEHERTAKQKSLNRTLIKKDTVGVKTRAQMKAAKNASKKEAKRSPSEVLNDKRKNLANMEKGLQSSKKAEEKLSGSPDSEKRGRKRSRKELNKDAERFTGSENVKNSTDEEKTPTLRTSSRLRRASQPSRDIYKHTRSHNASSERETVDILKTKKPIKSKGVKKHSRRRKARKYRVKRGLSKVPFADDQQRYTRRPLVLNASDSDSSSTDEIMERKRRKDLNRDRSRIRPINMELVDEQMAPGLDDINHQVKRHKGSNVEITPMKIDLNVDWNSIGGLQGHIQKLKEMVVLPMLYPNEFEMFKMQPPKGVIFHGPPGTGKTLVARVLAAQCSQAGKNVSFYMRKGADCLSKWVGEAERQLRLLFDEAHKNQPSIIFFDEIDGLAPVRSSRQDQIHSSIVSTLLALMDGLDGRGQIIIIGATNRIDAIDPALRRPGRFDRELCFTLPSRVARKHILQIKTKSWKPPLDEQLIDYLSEKSVGYCGADLEALCREAFMNSIRRTFPQIYQSDVKLRIDPEKLVVTETDFQTALTEIVPSAQRSQVVYARPLPKLLRPLLKKQLEDVLNVQKRLFPLSCATKAQKMNLEKDSTKENVKESFERNHIIPYRPKLLISAPEVGHGQSHLGVSILHHLEEFPVYSLDLASLYGDVSCRTPEEVVLRMFKEARKNAPSVIYWPHIDRWWEASSAQLQLVIYSLIEDLPEDAAVFLIATSDAFVDSLSETLQEIFNSTVGHYVVEEPSLKALEEFWLSIVTLCKAKPKRKAVPKEWPKLELDQTEPKSKNCQDNDKEKEMTRERDLDFIRLRTFVRTCCTKLVKHFSGFCEAIEEDRVVCNDLSLIDVRERNNSRLYPTLDAFLSDIDQIVANVRKSYNPNILEAREFMNEACHLQDQALALTYQADRALVKRVAEHIANIQAAGGDITATKYDSKTGSSLSEKISEKRESKTKSKKHSKKIKDAEGKHNDDNAEDVNQQRQHVEVDMKNAEVFSLEELLARKSAQSSDKSSTSVHSLVSAEVKINKKGSQSANLYESSEERVVEIDEDRLVKILKKGAKIARKCKVPIFELEDVYFRIINHIHHFSSFLERNGLIDLIEKELGRLKKVAS